MKKKQFKRFIAWGFTVLAVFMIASFSFPVRSYADSTATIRYYKDSTSTEFYVYLYNSGDWEVVFSSTSTSSSFSYSDVSLTLAPGLYRLYNSSYKKYSGGAWSEYTYNNVVLSTSSSSPTIISSSSFSLLISSAYTTSGLPSPHFYYFEVVDLSTPTPTPVPTPTPTPTAPPTPTQDPTITSDIQFWGRVNTNANGFWQVLTQIFNGIFNNVVMRNMIVYIPLFGLIITLVVYLFTFGGRHD